MNTKYETFHDQLTKVPPIPDNAFVCIETGIRKQHALGRMVWALAATVIIAVGIVGFTASVSPIRTQIKSAAAPEEVFEELYSMNSFTNSDSADYELALDFDNNDEP